MEANVSGMLSATFVKAEARRLGFSACGLAPAGPVDPAHVAFFRDWLARGCQAGMAYLERHGDLRADPRRLMDGCRTVVSVALNYRPAESAPDGCLQLSWYAYGKDYHDVVRAKLQSLLSALQAVCPALRGRACCDTAPVLERYWAWRCGVGWLGRHTQVVVPRAGSAFFLGELLLDVPADRYDVPPREGCGSCMRCVESCPTHALSGQGLDACRCLSYLTIEHKGEIPEEAAAKMFPYFYGCDRCLRACPHLRFAPPAAEPAFSPRPGILALSEEDWLRLDVEQYRQLFRGSAVKRVKYEGLKRNLEAIRKSREPR